MLWVWGLSLLVVLPAVAQGGKLKACLTDELLNSLPPSIGVPAQQLMELLKEHQFLEGLRHDYNVDGNTVGALNSMVSQLHEIIYQIIQSVEDLSALRIAKDLPSPLRLLACLSDTTIETYKKGMSSSKPKTWLYSARLKPSLPRFYICSKHLASQMESILSMTEDMIKYWIEAPRPLPPLRDTWLAPHMIIAMEIHPLCHVAAKGCKKLGERMRDMPLEELERLEKDLQSATEKMGGAFAEFLGHLGSTSARFTADWFDEVFASIDDGTMDNPAEEEIAYLASIASEQQRRVIMALKRLLVDHAIQALYIRLSTPQRYLHNANDLDCGDQTPSSSSDDSEGESLNHMMTQEEATKLKALCAEIVKTCQVVIGCHAAHPGNFAKLQSAVNSLKISREGIEIVQDALLQARQWPETQAKGLSDETAKLLADGWTELATMARAIDEMLSLIIDQFDEDQGTQLLLRLLAEDCNCQLYWLLPWTRTLMFVIESKITGIPKDSEYNWDDDSSIVRYARSMAKRRPGKSARSKRAIAGGD